MSTCKESCHNYTYMAEGLVGEAGEFFSKVVKAVRKEEAYVLDNNLYGKDELKAGLKAELGDCAWFLAGIASVFGWTLEEVCQGNVDKLAARQKNNTIVGSGDGVTAEERKD